MITFWDRFGNAVNNLLGWKKNSWIPFNAAYQLGQKGAVWMDVEKPFVVYETIPQIKTIIDRKAMMFANMDLRLVKADDSDEVVEDMELKALIENPNIMQGMNEWLVTYKQQEQVYGNQFMYKNKPSRLTKYPLALWNVSALYVRPVLTGKVFDQVKISGIVKEYQYEEQGNQRKFDVEDILWSRLGDLNDPLLGKSPIYSLKMPVSNTEEAYKYRNVIMSEKGAIGILSNSSKDAMGAIPLKSEERDRVEKEYRNKYGIAENQAKILITGASLTWQPMTFPTKDMLLFEEVDANTLTMIDHFGMNVNMFSNKDATFENVKSSILQVYRDTIQPEADKFAQRLGPFIGVQKGFKLQASYEHLEIFKENKEKGVAAVQNMITWLTGAIGARLISVEQAQTILGNELGVSLDAVATAPDVTQ